MAVVAAAPVDVEPIKTLRFDYDQKPNGEFSSAIETENGIFEQKEGQLKEVIDEEKKPHIVLVLRGGYKYTSPEGKVVDITYTADENGFQANGDAIPTVPARR